MLTKATLEGLNVILIGIIYISVIYWLCRIGTKLESWIDQAKETSKAQEDYYNREGNDDDDSDAWKKAT